MRVLQILPELNVGGVETGTVDFAKYLVEHGHHSVVVSNGGKLVSKLEESGSKHYTLPVHRKSILTAIRMVKALRKIIDQEQIDIVHARSRVPAWIAYFAVKKTKAAFITTCHGYYHSRFFSQVMGWPKLVITPSEIIARYMMEYYKVPSENIRCIPRSVDLQRFQDEKKEAKETASFVVTIVGRITPLKGHTYFIQAMARVIRSFPYVKVWVIGNPPAKKEFYLKELQGLCQRLGIAHNVEFLGSRSDIPELLAQTDVLCMASIEPESFGRVILEAQACGVPVVATKVGGVVEIIDDEETGLMVMSKDSDAMANAVMRLLKDPALGKRLTLKAQEKIRNKYTIDHMASATIKVYEELTSSFNILIIKIGAIGDVILSTAAIKSIRLKYPNAKIYCLVGEESRPVLAGCPYVDELIIYDYKKKERGLSHFWKLSQKLRSLNFDLVIDFQNNRKSHILSFLAFPKKSLGFFNKKFARLLTDPVKNYAHNIAPVQHQFQILKELGIAYHDNIFLEFWIPERDKKTAQALLDSQWLGGSQKIVGINIAASAKWKTKNWPLEHIAKLCDMLPSKNIRVVITGMPKDKDLAEYLMTLIKTKPVNLVGKTDILQLAHVIKQCKVFITPDTAPLHIAAALHTPVIALFGPTSSVRHMPPAKKMIVLERKLECAPCYSRRCKIMTHACMQGITADEVYKKVLELME